MHTWCVPVEGLAVFSNVLVLVLEVLLVLVVVVSLVHSVVSEAGWVAEV